MVSGPITSWLIDGETVETVADFIFLGSKITADGDCSHELKDSLEGESFEPRQHIKKQRCYFANKGLSRLWFFQLSCMDVSWTIKKAECRRIDAFELWCWRRLLDCKVIQPDHPKDQSWCSLLRLLLKLKVQYFGHLMRRADSLEKTLMLGKIEGRRRRQQKMR